MEWQEDALCMYFSQMKKGEVKLFPDSNQYDRFRKFLSNLCIVLFDDVAEELERRAINPHSLGTHSHLVLLLLDQHSCPSSAAVILAPHFEKGFRAGVPKHLLNLRWLL
jgi:hypothetical protein